MKILEKTGNEAFILALPNEEVSCGDYLIISDDAQKRQMVVQVYDESYLDTPEVVNDLVREEVLWASTQGVEHDPHQISTMSYLIRDMRVLKCKIRGSLEGGGLIPNVKWLPSRVTSKVRRLSLKELSFLAGVRGHRPISIGRTKDGEPFDIYAELLDGRLNIITGKKGTGKSHLAKLLVAELVKHGAYVFVFDLNNEYGGIGMDRDGRPNSLSNKVLNLVPGTSLRFTLGYISLSGMIRVLHHALDLPGVSLREFIRIWNILETEGRLSLHSLHDLIQKWRCNELVRDAILSRYHTILSSGLFTDREEASMRFEDLATKLDDGGAIVINLAGLHQQARKISVELILGKIIELLERKRIPPTFLFAEEAHLYLRDTYWDDIVTRMRHFGIFATFITNQPDAIKESIYRQADNFFLFNFTNSTDLEAIARASATDADTIKFITRVLPPRICLVVGKVFNDLPVVIDIKPTDMLTLGETCLFFKSLRQKVNIR